MGRLWGRWLEIGSLDSDGLVLYISELFAPVFIGLEALFVGENGLKTFENWLFQQNLRLFDDCVILCKDTVFGTPHSRRHAKRFS